MDQVYTGVYMSEFLQYVDRKHISFILQMYMRGDHFQIFNEHNCVKCQARFWVDAALHWCIVKDTGKEYTKPPNCTECDWNKFILEVL